MSSPYSSLTSQSILSREEISTTMASSSAAAAAAAAAQPTFISLLFFIFFVTISSSFSINVKTPPSNPTSSSDPIPTPTPTPWPHQFHSILVMNYSGSLSIIDLWYDWSKGRNFNIIQNQLGELLYDLEWNNGTSFFYTLDSNKKCRSVQLEVGILRPNWLDGAKYLGQKYVDGFLCNVWEKVDFIWYYEDVVTKRPVHWVFYTGRNAHVMTFEVGAALEDEKWQAPVYCFDKKKKKKKKSINGEENTLKSAVDGGGDILRKTSSMVEERFLRDQ